MGRVKVIDKGPRNIDLDILLYTNGSNGEFQMVDWSDERLILPHKLMFEREFVLRPLSEYGMPHIKHAPSAKALQPTLRRGSPFIRICSSRRPFYIFDTAKAERITIRSTTFPINSCGEWPLEPYTSSGTTTYTDNVHTERHPRFIL
jgi:hypothetical protein